MARRIPTRSALRGTGRRHELLRREEMVQLRKPPAAPTASAVRRPTAAIPPKCSRQLPSSAGLRGHSADVRLALGVGPESA